MTVGQRLAKMRELAKINQEDVARAVGVGRATVSSWETDRRVPGRKRLLNLARFFNVSVEYLLGFDGEGPVPPNGDTPTSGRVSGMIFLPVYGSIGPGGGGLSRSRIVGQEVVAGDEVRDGYYFFFRVSDNAMEGDIREGYLALVREGDSEVADGDVVLVSVNAEDAVLRRYRRAGGTGGILVLQPDNPAYPLVVAAPGNVHIMGKVIWVKFRP